VRLAARGICSIVMYIWFLLTFIDIKGSSLSHSTRRRYNSVARSCFEKQTLLSMLRRSILRSFSGPMIRWRRLCVLHQEEGPIGLPLFVSLLLAVRCIDQNTNSCWLLSLQMAFSKASRMNTRMRGASRGVYGGLPTP